MDRKLYAEIEEGFPEQKGITDDFIQLNQNLMELDRKEKLLEYVPAYMLWLLADNDSSEHLVDMHTLNALAEYGRAKQASNEYLNFKYQCNFNQKLLVVKFLEWGASNLRLVDKQQLERSLRHWRLSCG